MVVLILWFASTNANLDDKLMPKVLAGGVIPAMVIDFCRAYGTGAFCMVRWIGDNQPLPKPG